jgi:peptidyl-prolyl cis-trans isomerase A (cyclophilin A)
VGDDHAGLIAPNFCYEESLTRRLVLKQAVIIGFAISTLAAIACSSSSSGGGLGVGVGTDGGTTGDDAGATDAGTLPISPLLDACTKDPGATPPAFDPSSATDPFAGGFSLTQALAGFPDGAGKLTAAITTEYGGIKCTLDDKNAPISVANFIGLARGTRPYKNTKTKKWQTGAFYDGLTWHRVIPDFVIQGGDPLGTGTGGPGYDLPVENQIDEPLGTLAQAAGTAPSGSQFYIVVGTGPAAQYNVFGTCDTTAAKMIAAVARDKNDKPTTPVHMLKVDIGRCP